MTFCSDAVEEPGVCGENNEFVFGKDFEFDEEFMVIHENVSGKMWVYNAGEQGFFIGFKEGS